LRNRHHFDHQRQTRFLAGFDHVFETFFAKTLKGVGRCARFEDSAAQGIRACLFDNLRDFENLGAALDRAGSRDDRDFCAADCESVEFENRILFVELARGEFVWLGYTLDFQHAWERLEDFTGNVMPVTDRADDGLLDPEDGMRG